MQIINIIIGTSAGNPNFTTLGKMLVHIDKCKTEKRRNCRVVYTNENQSLFLESYVISPHTFFNDE